MHEPRSSCYNFSTLGVWTKGTTSASFDIPESCETGASTLQVTVNGIASNGVAVKLSSRGEAAGIASHQ